MLNIIPAIDLLDQRVVRLRQGNYDAVTFYDTPALDMALHFESLGATHLHVVDLSGARNGTTPHAALIKQLCKHTSLSIDVGGGIRSLDTVHAYLEAGAAATIIGSLFIDHFDDAAAIAKACPARIIAGVDAKNNTVATQGWETVSNTTASSLINALSPLPLHSIIYTDIAKDGMMAGPNLAQLRILSAQTMHPVTASGGVHCAADILALEQLPNVPACIVGKAVLDNPLQYKVLCNARYAHGTS